LAYLQSLKGGDTHAEAAHHDGLDDHATLLDQVVGDYRIRVVYHEAKAGSHSQEGHAHSGPGGGTAKATAQNHLMAFITDVKTAEPVPYLSVSAMVSTTKRSPRMVRLTPMMGDQGFHYGADVTLPPRAAKVTLSIGPTTMRVMPSVAGRFARSQQVSLEWTPPPLASPGTSGHAPPHQGHGQHGGAEGH
jgi:uncharacterized protein involved in high-affinity Fe2+ transport